ncbi:MAG: group III truncated hemoglobin [Nonlabens sp.]|nr:group III truncated hemoglobin [Nonlabens sp.]
MESTNLLNNRAAIDLLVSTFYAKVRANNLLGPIFNSVITDWPAHLTHIASFWETNLLRSSNYKGNPIEKHKEVDHAVNNGINMEHFGTWLQLWFETIDSLFHGEHAQLAKGRARNMSTFMFIKIYEARNTPSSGHTTS